jgi:RNA polymerase sigma factor (sigma-70 family)
MDDDLILWKSIQDGDTRALKVLHDRYYLGMHHYAHKLYANQSGLDESISDCFIKLWTKRHDILIEHSVKSYLFLMLRNGLIDRTRKKTGIILVDFISIAEPADISDIDDFDYNDLLYKALEKLPEQRRRILELAVFKSFSYAQIAEELQISVNTVKTQIGRAYRFLKEELESERI